MKKYLIFILLVNILFQSCAQNKKEKIEIYENKNNIIFVNSKAQGENTGKNWQNAFTSLVDAIAFSNETEEIWVAEGLYFPLESLARNSSFEIKKNTKLYGGFKGWETKLEQRDINNNKTILSGDIGLKDEMSDNSYHVVIGNDDALLDGFIVENGYALPETDSVIKDINLNYYGGGIFNNNVSMTIKNVIFRNNHALYGGAAYNSLYSKESPIIYNNAIFKNNFSQIKGGAITNSFINKLLILNSKFLKNRSANKAGAIYNGEYSYQILENTLFEENSAELGGAIATNEKSATMLNSSSLIENSAKLTGAAIYQEKTNNNYIELNGSEIKKNSAKFSDIQIFSWDENLISEDHIKNSLNKKLFKRGFIENQSNIYNDFDLNIYDYQFDDLKRKSKKLTELLFVKPDIKKSKTLNQKIIHVVNDNLEGEWDGKNWETAFRDLQKALDYAYQSRIKNIWIQEGIYRPKGDKRTNSFIIYDGLKIFGGFRGTEKKLTQRSYLWHKTILSGNIGDRKLITDNVYHTLTSNGDVYLDGLVIGWGNADSPENITKGGALYSSTKYGDEVIIKNSVFEYSHADYGGAVYVFGEGKLELDNVKFKLNSAKYGGALVSRVDGDTELKDSIFEQNRAKFNGGAFYSDNGSRIKFTNVDFRYNKSKNYGGSVYLADYVNNGINNEHILYDSIISDSESKTGAALVLISDLELKITDTYFFNNYSADKKGYIRALENSTVISENITQENNY